MSGAGPATVVDPLLTYVSGSEHAPGDARGEDWLVIHADGAFQLTNRCRGRVSSWAGQLADGVAADVRARLAASGFPAVPRHPIPGGSALRELRAHDGVAMLAWHEGGRLPGYAELFTLLDAIVTAARDDDASGPIRDVAPRPAPAAAR